jgi:putative transposase
MPLWRAHYHLVWTTSERAPWIEATLEQRLYGAIRSVAERYGAIVHAIDGTADHVHTVASIPPTVAVTKLIGEAKGAASHLANHDGGLHGAFSWSRGYGLFTLGPSQLERAIAYVQGQKAHHRAGTTIPTLEATAD